MDSIQIIASIPYCNDFLWHLNILIILIALPVDEKRIILFRSLLKGKEKLITAQMQRSQIFVLVGVDVRPSVRPCSYKLFPPSVVRPSSFVLVGISVRPSVRASTNFFIHASSVRLPSYQSVLNVIPKSHDFNQ